MPDPDLRPGCMCHLGSAAACPIHTRADFDAQDAQREPTLTNMLLAVCADCRHGVNGVRQCERRGCVFASCETGPQVEFWTQVGAIYGNDEAKYMSAVEERERREITAALIAAGVIEGAEDDNARQVP